MSIKKNYNEYLDVFKETNISIELYNNLLTKLKSYEKIIKINRNGTIATFFIFIVLGIANKSVVFAIGIIGLPIGSLVYLYFRDKANIIIADLDSKIFNDFLINNIKILYPNDEKGSIKYIKIKHITTKVLNPKNVNQAVIELAYIGFKEGAEGVIIVSSNSANTNSTIVSNKAGATVVTNNVHSAEGILIKDIEVNNDISISERFDLGYWHSLLEKGAISQEEYDVKKKELLES